MFKLMFFFKTLKCCIQNVYAIKMRGKLLLLRYVLLTEHQLDLLYFYFHFIGSVTLIIHTDSFVCVCVCVQTSALSTYGVEN